MAETAVICQAAPSDIIERIDTDVVVVGSGTAGTHTALALARSGWRVVVLERRGPDAGGARWCNGVVRWQFERAGVAFPAAPELRRSGGRTYMYSPSGGHRLVIEGSPMCEADMRLLGQRLRADAEAAGVEFRWSVEEATVRWSGRRVAGVEARSGDTRLVVSSRLTVDASGLRGVLRSQVPSLAAACPEVAPPDLCSAQQLVVEIDDRAAAQRFLDSCDARPGDSVSWMAPSGGFSVMSLCVEESMEEASLLTGVIADGVHGTGHELMRQLRAQYPWLGRQIFGGGGLIPLRRTPPRLTAPGIALVGDAGCQVMAAHGSGIGFGLIAGKVLAEALAGASDPGAEQALWGYQARFLREFGPTLASFDVFRRMSVALGSDGIESLFASGVFDEEMALPGLAQQLVDLPIAHLLAKAKALAASPPVARAIVPVLVRATAARVLFVAYPRRPSERGLRWWTAVAKRILDGGVRQG